MKTVVVVDEVEAEPSLRRWLGGAGSVRCVERDACERPGDVEDFGVAGSGAAGCWSRGSEVRVEECGEKDRQEEHLVEVEVCLLLVPLVARDVRNWVSRSSCLGEDRES